MKRRSAAQAALVVGVLAIAAGAGAQEHEVSFAWPLKTGDRFEASATLSGTDRAVKQGPGGPTVLEETKVRMELDADVEVIEMSPSGAIRKSVQVVKRSVLVRDGRPHDALKTGTKLTVTHKGLETEILADGRPLPEEVSEPLEAILDLYTGDLGDQLVFAPTAPQKIGASWPVNREAVVRELAAEGVRVEVDKIKGTVTLEGLKAVDGTEWLDVESTLAVTGFVPPSARGGNLTMSFASLLPRNRATGPALVRIELTSVIDLDGSMSVETNEKSEARLRYGKRPQARE